MRSALPVGVAAMGDREDINALGRIVDQVENPIVSDTEPVGLLTMQFLNAEGSRMLFQQQELVFDPVEETSSERVELAFSRALEDDVVAQWGRRLTRSAR